jgi:hypothetical protein
MTSSPKRTGRLDGRDASASRIGRFDNRLVETVGRFDGHDARVKQTGRFHASVHRVELRTLNTATKSA